MIRNSSEGHVRVGPARHLVRVLRMRLDVLWLVVMVVVAGAEQ
jgi:hypothetical protein